MLDPLNREYYLAGKTEVFHSDYPYGDDFFFGTRLFYESVVFSALFFTSDWVNLIWERVDRSGRAERAAGQEKFFFVRVENV